MKANNQYSAEAFQNNKKYAESTQEAVNVDKSRVAGLLFLAYNMGATNENAQKVVNTAIGLNKSLGVDMERAIRGTILAMNGHTEQLARFIPELKGVKDGVYGLNQVLELGAKGYKEAEDATKTFGGQIKQLGLNANELKEGFGEAIAKGIQPTVTAINDFIKKAKETGEIKALFQGIVVVVAILGSSITGVFKIIIDQASGVIDVIRGLGTAVDDMVHQKWKKAGDDMVIVGKSIVNSGKTFVADVKGYYVGLVTSTADAIKNMNKTLDASQEDSTNKLKDQYQKKQDVDKAYLQYLKRNLDAQLMEENEHYEKIKEQSDRAGYDQEAIEKAHLENIRKIYLESSKQTLDGFSEMFTNLSELMKTKNKEMFEIGKAASIANATIATYESATKAFNAMADIPVVGPALGVAAAAAAIAAGIINIDKIGSQSFAKGSDYIPYDMPAMVHRGERILRADQNIPGVSNASFAMAAKQGITNNNVSNNSSMNQNNNFNMVGMTINDVFNFSRRVGANAFPR